MADDKKIKNYILAASRNWNPSMIDSLAQQTGHHFSLVTQKESLEIEFLKKISPEFIFFSHWSFIIPEEIYTGFNCVVFHMTDLPFGRGGSPLQNLIARGVYHTKLSAIKCEKGIDTGPVYMKEDLSLHGSAHEIYKRAGLIIEKMIIRIIQENPIPVKQEGTPVVFKRRTPEESNIENLETLAQVYDYIRMLDAPGYPKAFLNQGKFNYTFSDANHQGDKITAKVTISLKPDA